MDAIGLFRKLNHLRDVKPVNVIGSIDDILLDRINRLTHIQTDDQKLRQRETFRKIDNWIDREKCERMNRWTDRQMDRWMVGQMN